MTSQNSFQTIFMSEEPTEEFAPNAGSPRSEGQMSTSSDQAPTKRMPMNPLPSANRMQLAISLPSTYEHLVAGALPIARSAVIDALTWFGPIYEQIQKTERDMCNLALEARGRTPTP